MNIPPKYEDVVAQLDAAMEREAALQTSLDAVTFNLDKDDNVALALREELDHMTALRDTWYEQYQELKSSRQQRLTVAEHRESLLKDLLTNAYIAINTMEPGFYLLEKIDAALKPAEVREGK